MDPKTPSVQEPAHLRLLRRLVTVLTVTMIVGVVTIVGLLVTSLGGAREIVAVPEVIEVPEGEAVLSFTRGSDWFAVVTRDSSGNERIRVFGLGGTERQVIAIARQGG